MNLDKKSYIVGLSGLIVAILGVVLAYASIRASWQIAEASGGFDKADIAVGIGGQALSAGKPNFIFIGAKETSVPDSIVIGAIPFTFDSIGKKSLHEVAISFQYHTMFRRALLEEASQQITGAFLTTGLQKRTASDADRFFVTYAVDDLNPGVQLNINEPIFINKTEVDDTIAFKSKDGVPMSMAYKANYSMNFGMAVSAQDTQVLGYSITMAVQKASSLQDLASGRVQAHIEQRQRDIRAELGTLSYIGALLTSSPREKSILIYVPLQKVSSGQGVILSPDGEQEVGVISYPLVSWHHLF